MEKILITGVQGQTGSYLAELLTEQNWEVHGTVTAPSDIRNHAIPAILHPADLKKPGSLTAVLKSVRPDAIVNLAAISSVAESWKRPTETFVVNAGAANEILSFIIGLPSSIKSQIRIIQASSSEIFESSSLPLEEASPYGTRNPYGVSKLAAHLIGHTARSLGFRWNNAILFNHESPRRPINFLSKKVAIGVAEISLGLRDVIELGDLSPKRDWGWAPDIAEALSLLLHVPQSGDFIISTGVSHSVEEFVSTTFEIAGITNWKDYVITSNELIRPVETMNTVGLPFKFIQQTGWTPTKSFEEIISTLLEYEISQLKQKHIELND